MTFRANVDSESENQKALDYLVGRAFAPEDRAQSRRDFEALVRQHGPVVQSYPCWHPLVACGNHRREPWTMPSQNHAYRGLDHTVLFRDAFLTCPYSGEQEVIEAVMKLTNTSKFLIEAEELDVKLYHPLAKPILVKYDWGQPLNNDGTLPKALVVPLLLEFELPHWRTYEVAETWETMRNYILGQPSGRLSSLFINKETGTVLKKLWNALVDTGMFGPIKV